MLPPPQIPVPLLSRFRTPFPAAASSLGRRLLRTPRCFTQCLTSRREPGNRAGSWPRPLCRRPEKDERRRASKSAAQARCQVPGGGAAAGPGPPAAHPPSCPVVRGRGGRATREDGAGPGAERQDGPPGNEAIPSVGAGGGI